MAARCVAFASQAVAPRAAAPRRANHARATAAAGWGGAAMRRTQPATSGVGVRRVGGKGVIVAASKEPVVHAVEAEVVRNPRPEYIPSKIDDPNYVRVFDTTLRDGEQSPGAWGLAGHGRPAQTLTPIQLAPPPPLQIALNLKNKRGSRWWLFARAVARVPRSRSSAPRRRGARGSSGVTSAIEGVGMGILARRPCVAAFTCVAAEETFFPFLFLLTTGESVVEKKEKK